MTDPAWAEHQPRSWFGQQPRPPGEQDSSPSRAIQVAGAAASPPSTYSGGRPYDDAPRSYDDDGDENFPPDSPSNDGGGDPDWPF